MSLESFIGLDQGEGMNEAAFEAFKERMKAAAAQIAAIKKEEGKQKKNEEELLKTLLKFVKNSNKSELVYLISLVLEKNIPANFILAIIVLGNEEIKHEVGKFVMLQSGKEGEANNGSNEQKEERSLVFFSADDQTLPLKLKIEIDNWIKNMMFQAEETPQKLLKTAYKIDFRELPRESEYDDPRFEEIKEIQPPLIQLATYVLKDFMEQNKHDEPNSKLYEFCTFILNGILTKTHDLLENRKLLES